MKRGLKQALYQEVGYPLIDHTEYLKQKDAIVSFAYPFDLDSVRRLVGFCDEHNLIADFDGYSEYGHGTIRIIITEKGRRNERIKS